MVELWLGWGFDNYILHLAVPLERDQQNQQGHHFEISSKTDLSKVTSILQHVATDESLSYEKKKTLYVRKYMKFNKKLQYFRFETAFALFPQYREVNLESVGSNMNKILSQ